MAFNKGSVGAAAPDFRLMDHTGGEVSLYAVLANGPALLAFYPGDFTMVCTKQLCNYRDNMPTFRQYGLQVLGISGNTSADHQVFAKSFDFPFKLLSDPQKNVAKEYGCTSLLLLGGISRAVFIVGRDRRILYRYVEPTTLTHRKADEISENLKRLRSQGSI